MPHVSRRAEAHEGRNAVSVGTGEGVRAHERAGDGAERADRDEDSREITPISPCW